MNQNLDQIKIKWLQLIRTSSVGPITFWQLLKHYEDIDYALSTVKNPYSYELASREYELALKKKCKILVAFEPDFPSSIKMLADCPPVLFVLGDASLLHRPALGIVGARNASLNGRELSEKIAMGLSDAGWIVVSGLARGIDGAAHQGALQGGTVAVVAGGVDSIYPPEHAKLYQAIAEKGAIISEMPLGLSPSAHLFPRRNRLIASLSQGIVVVEAAAQSGSLITAQYALDQGKDIFAVPGSPFDPRCRGSNYLLKQGAVLIESAQDILNVVGVSAGYDSKKENEIFEKSEKVENKSSWQTDDLKEKIMSDLSFVPLEVETLLTEYNCAPAELLGALAEMEVEGLIEKHAGNRVALKEGT